MSACFNADEVVWSSLAGASRSPVVMGPLGEPLTLDTLPDPDCDRWTPRRKAQVVAAVTGGLLTMDEACARYSLSLEEFAGWQRAVDRSCIPGLRATRAQKSRNTQDVNPPHSDPQNP